MGDVVLIEQARTEKQRAQHEAMIAGLEKLLDHVKAGEVLGICYTVIPQDRRSLWVCALKEDACGAHELVGASAMLADYVAQAARD